MNQLNKGKEVNHGNTGHLEGVPCDICDSVFKEPSNKGCIIGDHVIGYDGVRCEKCGQSLPNSKGWEEEFDKRFPPVSQWSSRSGDYTESPIPHIKAFIHSIEQSAMSKGYVCGLDDGRTTERKRVVGILEGMKGKSSTLWTLSAGNRVKDYKDKLVDHAISLITSTNTK